MKSVCGLDVHKDTNFKANHNQIDGMMKRFKNITWFKLLGIYPVT